MKIRHHLRTGTVPVYGGGVGGGGAVFFSTASLPQAADVSYQETSVEGLPGGRRGGNE